MRFVAATLPVNTPDQQIRLTKEQVFEGLKVKARDPTKFVSVISKCEVLSENPTGLLREVQFKNQPAPAHERVEFFPPGLATFTMISPKTGEQLAHITNVISTTPDGELALTFTFAVGPNGPPDTGEEAEAQATEREKMAYETIARTLSVIRGLVKTKAI